MLLYEGLKRFRQILFGVITLPCLNRNMKLSLNFITKDTKMRKKAHNDFSLDKVK